MLSMDIIQRSLDYIEEHLKTDFSTDILAASAGYSPFHYNRLFQQCVGLSVAQYIVRRKLLHAAYEISNGSRVIDVALAYGFETNAGFYKAFLREFHCSPSEYVARHTASPPYKIRLIQEEHIMLTERKIRDILCHWNKQTENIGDLYYAGSGRRSDSEWNIGKEWILKIVVDRQALEKQVAISRTLIKRGFQTPPLVKTCEGTDYYFDGKLYFYLEKKIEGLPVKSSDAYKENGHLLSMQLGETIGKLDLLLGDLSETICCKESYLLQDIQNWAIPKIKGYFSLPQSFFEDYRANFSALYRRLPKQLIHRNPCSHNFLMENRSLSGMSDFTLCEKNIRIFDPCYTATSILSENFSNKDIPQCAFLLRKH